MKKLIQILKEIQQSKGYWIDKHGKTYNVDDDSTSHYRYAEQNFEDVKEYISKTNFDKYAPGQAVIDIALKLGYVRVIEGKYEERIDYYIQLDRDVLTNRAKNTLLYLMSKNKIKQITFDDRRTTRSFFDLADFEDNLSHQLVLRESQKDMDFIKRYHPREQKLIQLSLTTKKSSKEVEQIILRDQNPIAAYMYLVHIQNKAYNKEAIEKILKRDLTLWSYYENLMKLKDEYEKLK